MACTFIPALQRQKQADLYEFEATLVYRVSSRTAKATQRNLVLKKKKRQGNQETCLSPLLSLKGDHSY